MTSSSNSPLALDTDRTGTMDSSGMSRRRFLGGLGGAAAAAVATSVVGLEPLANAAPPAEAAGGSSSAGVLRRNACYKVRKDAADFAMVETPVQHLVKGHETRFPSRIGNYSKS